MDTDMEQSLAIHNLDFLEGLELPPAFGWELPQLKQDASAIGADDGRFQHSPSLLRRGPTASPTRVAHASQSPTESPTWRSSEACAVVTPGSVRSRDTAACAVPSAPAPKRSRVLTASNMEHQLDMYTIMPLYGEAIRGRVGISRLLFTLSIFN